jgi:hypothetical protein
MKIRRRRRIRLKTKRRASKSRRTSPHAMSDDGDRAQFKPHNLLLSSLRFWEVERDLIEERVSGMSR